MWFNTGYINKNHIRHRDLEIIMTLVQLRLHEAEVERTAAMAKAASSTEGSYDLSPYAELMIPAIRMQRDASRKAEDRALQSWTKQGPLVIPSDAVVTPTTLEKMTEFDLEEWYGRDKEQT